MVMDLAPLFTRLQRNEAGWVALPVAEVPLRYPLNAIEVRRAARFRKEPDRAAYIAGRSLIRAALSEWMETARVPIEITPKGKPFCPLKGAPDFNLSHAGGWVVLAMCRKGAVGVDIEDSRRNVDAVKLAARYFSAAEQEAVAKGAADAFFEIWTRKEAYLKATGEGIRSDLKQLDTLNTAGVHFESFYVGEKLPGTLAVLEN